MYISIHVTFPLFSSDFHEIEFSRQILEKYSMYISIHVTFPLFSSDFHEIEFSRQILEKYSSIKFHENPSTESQGVHADVQKDRQI